MTLFAPTVSVEILLEHSSIDHTNDTRATGLSVEQAFLLEHAWVEHYRSRSSTIFSEERSKKTQFWLSRSQHTDHRSRRFKHE